MLRGKRKNETLLESPNDVAECQILHQMGHYRQLLAHPSVAFESYFHICPGRDILVFLASVAIPRQLVHFPLPN